MDQQQQQKTLRASLRHLVFASGIPNFRPFNQQVQVTKRIKIAARKGKDVSEDMWRMKEASVYWTTTEQINLFRGELLDKSIDDGDDLY